ncbi:MAG: beta-propeller fold lactonase family protein [Acidimicrobiaceae bacterium]|nr:beta-propeller fold lactonase family protein [Acidimicrobiaceae bacterium]
MSADPTRRRLPRRAWAAAIAVAALSVPGAVYGLTAHPGSAPRTVEVGASAASTPGTDYHAYVTAIGNNLVEFDTASGSLLALLNVPRNPVGSAVLDSPIGIAATPDGSQVFVADEGKYNVLAVNTTTNASTDIELGGGGFPQDVAVSPDGSTVYATVTGPPNTGPGGPHQLAVLSTATDTVTGHINVDDSPRQVVFSPDGRRAYVTTEGSIDVVDTAAGRLVASIRDRSPGGPQDLAISPDGTTVYATNPVAGTLFEISTASNRLKSVLSAGDEPYAVAVSPDSKSVYVTDMNSNSVRVINAATHKTITNVTVQGLPASLAFTPDNSELWVGDVLTGNVSVIDPTINTVSRTVTAGLPAQETIDAAPIGFAFVKA